MSRLLLLAVSSLLAAQCLALPIQDESHDPRRLSAAECTGAPAVASAPGVVTEAFALKIKPKAKTCGETSVGDFFAPLAGLLGLTDERLELCLVDRVNHLLFGTVYSASAQDKVYPLSKLAEIGRDEVEDAIDFKIKGGFPFCLSVLHINDQHSRIEPINGFGSTCAASDLAANNCYGGAKRVWGAFAARRQALLDEGKRVLVLNAGDEFQGSPYFSLNKGELIAQVRARDGSPRQSARLSALGSPARSSLL
jgi:hypothetical protein